MLRHDAVRYRLHHIRSMEDQVRMKEAVIQHLNQHEL